MAYPDSDTRPQEDTLEAPPTDLRVSGEHDPASHWAIRWVYPQVPRELAYKALTVLGGTLTLGRGSDEPSIGSEVEGADQELIPVALDFSRLFAEKRSQVSRKHAALVVSERGLTLRNLSRKNFTFLNGVPVLDETPVSTLADPSSPLGAVLRIGEYIGIVVDQSECLSPGDWFGELSPGMGADVFPFEDERPYAGPKLRTALERACALLKSKPALPGRPSISLIEGRTGTGKELIARVLHQRTRPNRPLVVINCAAIPRGDVGDAELFGIADGVATSVHDRRGLFRAAHEGSIVLDEVQELPLELQAKLLRLLQDGSVQVVGWKKPESYPRVDIQVLAASNRQLEREVRAGHFREDLFERLNGHVIRVPSLSDRREDVLPLALRFLTRELGSLPALEPQLAELLCLYEWPRNVRQLRNEMTRIAAEYREHGAGAEMRRNVLSGELRGLSQTLTQARGGGAASEQSGKDWGPVPPPACAPQALGSRKSSRRPEQAMVELLLSQNRGNIREVARLLGVHAQRLYDWFPSLEQDAARYRPGKKRASET